MRSRFFFCFFTSVFGYKIIQVGGEIFHQPSPMASRFPEMTRWTSPGGVDAFAGDMPKVMLFLHVNINVVLLYICLIAKRTFILLASILCRHF